LVGSFRNCGQAAHAAAFGKLLNDLVGAGEHRGRQVEAERLGGSAPWTPQNLFRKHWEMPTTVHAIWRIVPVATREQDLSNPVSQSAVRKLSSSPASIAAQQTDRRSIYLHQWIVTLALLCGGAVVAAAIGEPTRIPKICADRDLQLVILLEQHGEARDVAPAMLTDAYFTVMRARKACLDGRVPEALATYDSIVLHAAESTGTP
jgi:hypothetical protein